MAPSPSPSRSGAFTFDALDYRIRQAMDAAVVRRMSAATYVLLRLSRSLYSEASTAKRRSCRSLGKLVAAFGRSVRISFEAKGRVYTLKFSRETVDIP